MSDLVITPANVVSSVAIGNQSRAIAAAAITAGQVVYINSSGQAALAQSSAAAPANLVGASNSGIALNSAAAGQPVNFVPASNGDPNLAIGATLTPGQAYYLSATAGNICPFTDVVHPDLAVLIGVAVDATHLNFRPLIGAQL